MPVLSLALVDSVKSCGAEALSLLAQMEQRDGLASADSAELKAILEVILATAEVHSLEHNLEHHTATSLSMESIITHTRATNSCLEAASNDTKLTDFCNYCGSPLTPAKKTTKEVITMRLKIEMMRTCAFPHAAGVAQTTHLPE